LQRLFPVFMQQAELIPHLFRTEYRKITAVLCKAFGIGHIEIAEDIASDTFLLASETWGIKGPPENPVAWLYTVAKNKAKNFLKRDELFHQKVALHIMAETADANEIDIDLSEQNITDSQLQMMFAICHPAIAPEAQVGLALRILCGFGINEIAYAFLTNKETIIKRHYRAREKLRLENVQIEFPARAEISKRLETVMTTLYLLFNEGYYSAHNDVTIQKDLCAEAMRLTYLLLQNPATNLPAVNALFALMSFQVSRFEARTGSNGEIVLYEDQDETLWDQEVIKQGQHYLEIAFSDRKLTRYHLEAGIASFHTRKADTKEKWEYILQLYNQLLILEYSPIAALNRTYALSKARSRTEAIVEAEKLQLTDNHFYHSLLGELYKDVDNTKALAHFDVAINLAQSAADKIILSKKRSLCLKRMKRKKAQNISTHKQ
jgi:RNA polymerase sigma factor (sigma-70 family)